MSQVKSQYEHLPYRPGVGMMLINHNNEVFVGRRIDTRSDAWQMPQGGIDEGEEPKEAAMRELLEEMGSNHATIIAESQSWFYYDLPGHLVPKLWDGKYRGQKQKWFALRFQGTNADICIQTEEPEFMDWRWVEMEALPDIIVPFKRKLYAEVIKEFIPMIEAEGE